MITNSRWSGALLAGSLLVMILSGCQYTRRDLPTVPQADEDCPPDLQNQIKLSVAAVPTEIPADFTPAEGSVQRYGLRGRRLTVSVLPDGKLSTVRTLSSTLKITVLGGTFLGWARTTETRALDVTPGRIKVTPFLQPGQLQAQTSWLDILVMPGGVPVDELTVNTGPLWDANGHPVEPGMVQIRLTPTEHLSILDTVEADIDLEYHVKRSFLSRHEWQCTVHTDLTLVDHNAVRPPLWDLGTPDSHGKRTWWLALINPKTGPFRIIFTSPAEAHGFATWLLQTGATRVGQYDFALVQPGAAGAKKPIKPVDWTVVETTRAASGNDLRQIEVGRIGEP